MNEALYDAYREWRDGMVVFQEDLNWDEKEDAEFAIWDAADHEARDDFNLFLAAKTIVPVTFKEMKAMEIQYDVEQ